MEPVGTIATRIKKKVRTARHRFFPSQSQSSVAELLYGKAAQTPIGGQPVSLGLGRGGGLRSQRYARSVTDQALGKPKFRDRDVRQMNTGKPGKQLRGPKVN